MSRHFIVNSELSTLLPNRRVPTWLHPFVHIYDYALHILQVFKHIPTSSRYSLETRPALLKQWQQRLPELLIHWRYLRPLQLQRRMDLGPRLYPTPRRVDIASVRNHQDMRLYNTDKSNSFVIDFVVITECARELLIWVLLTLLTEAYVSNVLAATL